MSTAVGRKSCLAPSRKPRDLPLLPLEPHPREFRAQRSALLCTLQDCAAKVCVESCEDSQSSVDEPRVGTAKNDLHLLQPSMGRLEIARVEQRLKTERAIFEKFEKVASLRQIQHAMGAFEYVSRRRLRVVPHFDDRLRITHAIARTASGRGKYDHVRGTDA